jgi:hypothetical protein
MRKRTLSSGSDYPPMAENASSSRKSAPFPDYLLVEGCSSFTDELARCQSTADKVFRQDAPTVIQTIVRTAMRCNIDSSADSSFTDRDNCADIFKQRSDLADLMFLAAKGNATWTDVLNHGTAAVLLFAALLTLFSFI